MPEIVFAGVDPAFGRTEPDEEIQDLLRFSEGLNLGLHFLSGAITYDPGVNRVDPRTASGIVWLDSLLMNVDRTVRNTNMLMWYKELWLIDHGAALYWHHAGDDWKGAALKPFVQVADHVLLPKATGLEQVDKEFKALLTDERIHDILEQIPDEWLLAAGYDSAEEARRIYENFLITRLQHSHIFIQEANARKASL